MRRRGRRLPKADFRSDPALVTLYQIAEVVGETNVDDLRDKLTAADLCEWGVFLNSPFSARGRDIFMNGWLVHTIRSILADKRHRPKFADSMFPFDKLSKEFFAAGKKSQIPNLPKGKPGTLGEVAHVAQIYAKRYEQALADYRAGRCPNRFGLYIHERLGR